MLHICSATGRAVSIRLRIRSAHNRASQQIRRAHQHPSPRTAALRRRPPPSRAFNPSRPDQRSAPLQSKNTETLQHSDAVSQRSLSSRIWPFSRFAEPRTTAFANEPKDAERGAAAARRVVTEGVLDDRYKEAARRWRNLIIALPIAIGLSVELFRRRFMGVEQKQLIKAPEARKDG